MEGSFYGEESPNMKRKLVE